MRDVRTTPQTGRHDASGAVTWTLPASAPGGAESNSSSAISSRSNNGRGTRSNNGRGTRSNNGRGTRSNNGPGTRSKSASGRSGPTRLPMLPFRVLAVCSAAIALGLAAWQLVRAMNGEERLATISTLEIATAVIAAVSTVAWTWIVVENARRLLCASRTSDPPDPGVVASSWAMPLVVAASAVSSVAFVERRLNRPEFDDTSTIPLALVCASLIVTLFVSYRPLFLLSAVIRRLGGGIGDLARWIWVPITMVIVGACSLIGLRAGGAYGEEFDGFAPAWAIGVVAIPPVLIVLSLAWRGCGLVEDAVVFAYGRRIGHHAAGVGRRDVGVLARALRADARPPIHRDVRTKVRLVPGVALVRLVVMISVAALTLISMVGALVMFLFWREASDGALLPSQRERAWNALSELQSLEWTVAFGVLVIATCWTFLIVLNARIASGRRRNPVLAAAAWPFAGVALWTIADRIAEPEDIGPLILRFALQGAVLYVPFFFLERAAMTVGARRSPLRLTWGIGVVLLIHIQGLGGLATLQEETDIDRFGRIAGYLALAALLELIATIAVTEASKLVGDASSAMAEKHNFLAEQRSKIDDRAARTAQESARVPAPSGMVAAAPANDSLSEPTPHVTSPVPDHPSVPAARVDGRRTCELEPSGPGPKVSGSAV